MKSYPWQEGVREVHSADYDDETKHYLGKDLSSFMFVERVREADILKEIATGEIILYGHRRDIDLWSPFDYSFQDILTMNISSLSYSI